MVLLRGLFGARLSYLPTVLNIAQCVGWGVFELVTIATAAHTVAPALPKTGYVLIAGAATALLTIRPLGAIRILRKYATGAVLVVLCYLFVQLIRHQQLVALWYFLLCGSVLLGKRNSKKGLATLCIGGGMGIAMCVER